MEAINEILTNFMTDSSFSDNYARNVCDILHAKIDAVFYGKHYKQAKRMLRSDINQFFLFFLIKAKKIRELNSK